jgi:hypothetical protein
VPLNDGDYFSRTDQPDDRFGSILALHGDNTRTAALERLAVVRYGFCGSQLANVRFSQYRTLELLKIA